MNQTMSRTVRLVLFVIVTLVGALPNRESHAGDRADDVYDVGAAAVDVTPAYPVRLSGFGFRRTESEGITQRIHAKALAISQGDAPPLVAITVDNLGVPAAVFDEVLRRINQRVKLPAERLAIASSHTHTAPMLRNVAPTLFSLPIPPDHQQHIDRYTDELTEQLAKLALEAIDARRSARLSYGIGRVGFAINRRAGTGPVDHDLPLLAVKDLDGKLRAVWATYACHCVTLSNNRISGDWAGAAQQAIEKAWPGATALVSIGCGADQNPNSGVTGDKVDIAVAQGEQIADEVKRLLGGFLAPVRGPLSATRKSIELPLADLPPRSHWEELAKRADAVGYHARVNLQRLDRKEPLKSKIDYPITTWSFGDSLAHAFLPGEVVVDYALRLKRELDNQRVWIHAYSNDAPCYIPSERILREGGYEGGGAMVYYDVPVPFRAGLEDQIVSTVVTPLLGKFASRVDATRTQGSLPRSPQQSLAAIKTTPGLVVELVAAEPLVVDPVAIDFGADGRLWVAEMHDYPSGLDGKFGAGGRVRVLTDVDRDGVFDRSVVFLEKLPFPTGITVWRKGVLVCAAPDVIYAEDTDGDGRADLVHKLLTGFGTENYQGRVNSLCFGLDGWLYGSCGLFGGEIHSSGQGASLALGNRDFRFRPDTGRIEPATGRTQQSRVRDDWDNWFGCDNSNLARHYVLADHYLRRNPHVAPPPISVNLAAEADGNRLFPLSTSAQRFKLSGAPNLVTAACGLGVYRDDLLGREFTGNLFTCEPVNLVVHRRVLKPDGSSFAGSRAAEDQQSEFLASTDHWFRPVQARTGPDGALWVVDMYRQVIEHPRWIPPEDLAKLDVRAGDALGRIYRVRPAERAARPIARLDQLDPAGLVAALDSPNGPQRDLASQLLVWKTDESQRAALTVELVELFRTCQRPEARLHALSTLEAFDQLTAEQIRAALADPHPGVRRLAVRLAEPFLEDNDAIADQVMRLAEDPDSQVRLQVACSLGELATTKVGDVLARLAQSHSDDPYLTGAVLSSLRADSAATALQVVLRGGNGAAPREQLVGRLVATTVATADADGLAAILRGVGAPNDALLAAWQWSALAGFLDALDRRGKPLSSLLAAADVQLVERIFARARETADDMQLAAESRIGALQVLGRRAHDRDADLAVTARQLGPAVAPTIRHAAIAVLGRIDDGRVPKILASGWSSHTPATQAQVIDTLLSRAAWKTYLVEELEAKRIPASQIDASRRQQLVTQLPVALRSRAEKALAGSTDPDRHKVIAQYRAALGSSGDATRGEAVFAKRCAACHRLGSVGHDIGPNLGTLANKTADYLLVEILDPNRNIDSRFLQYVAVMSTGQTLTGLLASESATSITLRGQEGKQFELLREDLEELKGTSKSLMPEGLERDVSPREMADLVALLTRVTTPPKEFAGNRPARVKPDADGNVALRAAQAEIRGGDIVFETAFRNIGFWHGLNDHATWLLDLPAAGDFDVYLDYSCSPDSASNRFAIDGVDPPLQGTIASTGGWDRFTQQKLTTVKLVAGPHRLTLRPDGATLRGALADVRTIFLIPKGKTLPPALVD